MFRINQLFRHIGRYSIIRTNVIHFPQIRSNTTPKIVPVNTNRNFYSTDSKLSENKPHTSNLAHQAHFFPDVVVLAIWLSAIFTLFYTLYHVSKIRQSEISSSKKREFKIKQ